MRRSVSGVCVASLLACHVALVAWGATRHSAVYDEVGHLPAGISHWKLGQFTLYKVNPPLVRMVAAIPVLFGDPVLEWHSYYSHPLGRPEFAIGAEFIELNRSRPFLVWARWACLTFTVLGGYFCYRWARALYGSAAGVMAAGIWCASPNILGNAQLMTPDLGAAAMGLTACYAFRGWLRQATWTQAVVAGAALGLAQLTKFTFVVLPPVWLALWIAIRAGNRISGSGRRVTIEFAQLTLLFALSLYVVNVGYAFEGSGQRLDSYRFISHTLSGQPAQFRGNKSIGNRFAGSWCGRLLVPVRKHYLLGIDQQKREFEDTKLSYLGGEWQRGGWWYYYLYAMAVKIPLGTWLLAAVALGTAVCCKRYRAVWQEEVQLLAPFVAVLILVSSETGFSNHMRYVLPCFPFLFVAISRLGRAFEVGRIELKAVVSMSLVWIVGGSLWIYPHSLSYFNELAGGPRAGYRHLLHSNTDWGQDILYLKQWVDEHPQARPIRLAVMADVAVVWAAGLESRLPPPGPDSKRLRHPNVPRGPIPGWYALSVNRILHPSRQYRYFLHFEPIAMAGYSIYIYHITPEEANRVRRELGLPELSSRRSGAERNTDVPSLLEPASAAPNAKQTLRGNIPERGGRGTTTTKDLTAVLGSKSMWSSNLINAQTLTEMRLGQRRHVLGEIQALFRRRATT